MKTLVITAIAFLGTAVSAAAQIAPDLKGTWSGQWRTVIYGQNPHHPGPGSGAGAPRIREIAFTVEVEGQDGRLLWGKTWSSPDRKEPFAATITADGKTIIGSDMDGSLSISIIASGAPFGALPPSPLSGEGQERDEGVPGASNNTGDGAWLLDNRIRKASETRKAGFSPT